MKRGPKPKPVKLKLLQGNLGKRKLPTNEIQPPVTRPEAPEHLNPYATDEWNRVIDIMYEHGMVTDLDVVTFGAYCSAYGEWRLAEEEMKKVGKKSPISAILQVTKNGNVIKNQLACVARTARSDAVRYGEMLGLSVSARARLALDSMKKSKSKFTGLIKGMG